MRPERKDHHAAFGQLVDQRLRNLLGGGRDNDAVEWRLLGNTREAVAGHDLDIGVAEGYQPRPGAVGKRAVALDGHDLAGEPRQHRRLISRAGPDLEHAVLRPLPQGSQHRGVGNSVPTQVEQEFHAADPVVSRRRWGHAPPSFRPPHDAEAYRTMPLGPLRPRQNPTRPELLYQMAYPAAGKVRSEPARGKSRGSGVRKGSSVMSSRSGVTEMRLSDSACRSVPLGE